MNMIQTLQKKFIVTSMTAITVLLLLLLGAINVVNIMMVGNEMDATLKIISDNEGDERNLSPRLGGAAKPELGEVQGTEPQSGEASGVEPQPGEVPETKPQPERIPNVGFSDFFVNLPKNEYDIFLSSNFFVVRFDGKGQIVYVDVSRTSAVSEAEAKTFASDAYEENHESGKVGKYRYRMTGTRNTDGKTIVFLDASNEIVSYIRVLLLSGCIGIVCWGAMLLFVAALSKRAIRPIAENMERQKQFVTNAGHEIKTPLAIIQSNTEAMELYNGENKWSRNIKEQTARLSDLMQNLLMLSRMDEADVQVDASRFSVSGLLEELLEGFLPAMELKGICLRKEITAGIFLYADKKHVEQLISILLDNAVKYTLSDAERPSAPQGHVLRDALGYALPDARIWICLQETEKRVRLRVQNTCESLPQVPPEKLFDRFYRADEARTQKSGGYGIGLSVAKSLVKANGGKIYAEYMQKSGEIAFVVEFKLFRE